MFETSRSVGKFAGLVAEREAFLVVLDGGDDDFRRHAQEILVELTHQHHGPFDEARHFLQQAFVLDHFQPLREGEILRFGADGFGADAGIDDDVGLVEFLGIVLKAADLDLFAAQEAVAQRGVARRDAFDLKRHDFTIEGADNGEELAHPAQGACAPAHGFWPGEFPDDIRQQLGHHIGCGAPGFPDRGDIERALLVVLNRELIELQSGGFQEAINGGLGRIGARALAFLAHISGFGIEAFDGEHEAAWRGVGLGAFIGESRFDEAVGNETAQIFRRPGLHAGGNFLGEKFDQEFRHGYLPSLLPLREKVPRSGG